MSKVFWKSFLLGTTVLGVSLTPSLVDKAAAAPLEGEQNNLNQVESYSKEGTITGKDQITSVNELRDVAPTDWAFEALRSLVERYGCIVGYPDRTFRGNKPLSRWEFAAGLNACLNVMERLIQEGGIGKNDIDKLKRLVQEFQGELAALGAKIDNLEGRVSFLENHQFSTTTKLNGEVVFSVAGASTANNQVVFQNRVRLRFDTSFTGKDLLITRLAAGNFTSFKSGANIDGFRFNTISPTTSLATSAGGGGDNNVSADWVAYQAPIEISKGIVLNAYVSAVGGLWSDFVPTLNPFFQDYDGGNGSISAFSQENPIYRIGGGAGAGFSLQLGFLESLIGPTSLSVGYMAGPNANNPTQGNGLTNGNSAILGQINANIANFLNVGFTYVNSYQQQGVPIFGQGGGGLGNALVGTQLANALVTDPAGNTVLDSRKVTNNYGVQAALSPFKGVSISAFGTYTNVNFVGSPDAGTGFTGTGEIWTYGGGIAFADLIKEGSILGVFAGVQPYFGNVSTNLPGAVTQFTTASPIQVELFYKYPVTDNISITPGVIWLSNPTQTTNASSQIIGVLRGTFKF